MTTPFVPFLRSNADEINFAAFYSDAPFVRVTLDKRPILSKVSPKYKLWIDLGLDGIANVSPADPGNNFSKYLHKHGDLSCLVDPNFLARPDRKQIENKIVALLQEASVYNPSYISVPQLPHAEGTKFNKVNRMLAEIAADWRRRQNSAQLILPVIFTNQAQLNTKAPRTQTIKFVHSLMVKLGIDAVWSVDSTLEDQLGTQNFERIRFKGVIDFWDELQAVAAPEISICGPYWGLGLVLWARGVVTHFGIGLGSTYRYYPPGGMPHKANARVAIEPLRRWVNATPGLAGWLQAARLRLPAGSVDEAHLADLAKNFSLYTDAEVAKRQVAQVYRRWLDKIVASPLSGRGVALYQDLSAAFVTGKMLPDLPDETGFARHPERVAEQLMLNCL